MPRKRNSLKYDLKKLALQNTENEKNDRTKAAYKRNIKRFAEWAKERGCRNVEDVTKELIQDYEIYLEQLPKSYSAATIHTYLAPICVAAGVPMEEIRKPRRKSGKIIRSRDSNTNGNTHRNLQGIQAECDPRYTRVVSCERAAGIRRAELAMLCGKDLIQRGEDWFIVVRRGKGGKRQEQYILPEDVAAVHEIFRGIGPDERVFSKEEMKNKIDFHGMRAGHARRCYAYYAKKIEADPAFADKMRCKLLKRWEEAHERFRASDPAGWARRRERFFQDMDDRSYKLRGDNLTKSLASGSPTEYNRLALMCVSVMHLSHWRLDVSVTNYIVK